MGNFSSVLRWMLLGLGGALFGGKRTEINFRTFFIPDTTGLVMRPDSPPNI